MKKSLKTLIVLVVIMLTSVISLSFLQTKKNVVTAFQNVADYSMKNSNNGVILSVEKVLRPITADGWNNGDYVYDQAVAESNEDVPERYDTYKRILTSNQSGQNVVLPFKDIANPNATYGTKNKTIIRKDFDNPNYVPSVMLNNIGANNENEVEAIMFSFGSYNNDIELNVDPQGNGTNNGQDIYNMLISAKLNGESIQVPSFRTVGFSNDEYIDFVMFINLRDAKYANTEHGHTEGQDVPKPKQEGKYQFTVRYNKRDAQGIPSEEEITFDFYVLSYASYSQDITIGSQVYGYSPKIANCTLESSKIRDYYYNYSINTPNNNYPTLTFDASKYQLTVSKIYNERLTTYTSVYDYNTRSVRLKEEYYGRTTYSDPISFDDNGITTIVFTDVGEYQFDFNVVYIDATTTRTIPEYEVYIESINLKIAGYQLEYNKNNSGEGELKQSYFYNNEKTATFVLSKNLNYQFTSDINKKAGNLDTVKSISADITNLVNANNMGSGSSIVSLAGITPNGIKLKNPDGSPSAQSITYLRTNQGPLWLNTYQYNYSDFETSYYYYAQTINSGFVGATSGTNGKIYTKDMNFVDVGYYILAMNYKVNGTESVTQIFAFEINAKAPKVELKLTVQPTVTEAVEFLGANKTVADITDTLGADEYTNKNIIVYWARPGIFENEIQSTFVQKNFNGSIADSGAITANTIFKTTGMYTATISFGAGSASNKIIINFYIDKEEISGLKIKGVEQFKDALGGTSYQYYKVNGTDTIYTSKAVIDRNFTILWNSKTSGANVTLKYSFTAFIRDDSIEDTILTDGSFKYVLAKYKLSDRTTTVKISGNKSTENTVSKNYVFTASGIYLFDFLDDAGNTLQYLIVLDKTEANIISEPEPQGVYNIVNVNTNITWGTHKTLKTVSLIPDLGNDIVDIIDVMTYIENGQTSYPKQSFKYAGLTNKQAIADMVGSGSGVLQGFYLINVPVEKVMENKIVSGSSNITEYIRGSNLISSKEIRTHKPDTTEDNAIYEYKVYTASNLDFLNSTKFNIEMNLDKSLLMIEAYDNDLASELGFKEYRLYDGDAGSPNYILLSWNKGEGNTEVEYVKYTFYPYALSAESENYPFAATPLTADQNVVIDSSESTDIRIVSMPVNLISENYYTSGGYVRRSVTNAGKYEITRKLANGDLKTYTFYIDRNGIIQYDTSNNKTIGKDIFVAMGNGTLSQNYKIKFDDFLQTPIAENIAFSLADRDLLYADIYFETNILPVKINLPANKYFSATGTNLDIFNLSVEIYYRALNGTNARSVGNNLQLVRYIVEGNDTGEWWIQDINGNLVEFKESGYYLIRIKDRTKNTDNATYDMENDIYYIDSNSGNYFDLGFKIANTKPNATFYGKPQRQVEKPILYTNFTKDNKLTLVVEEPTNPYSAKVDVQNIVIMRSYVGSNDAPVLETYYKKNGLEVDAGCLAANYVNEIFKTTVKATEFGNRNVYTFDLLYSAITDPAKEYTFTVTLYYEGDGVNYEVVENGNIVSYHSNTKSITIDRTPPTDTVEYLLSTNQNFLNDYGITDLYQKGEATTSTSYTHDGQDYVDEETFYSYFAKQFYAFAIDENFFIYKDNNKSSEIYYRYMDMESNSGKLQSLLPGDPRYYNYDSNPNNIRFAQSHPSFLIEERTSSNRMSFYDILLKNKDPNFNIDGYYEIVELDQAGNSTSYIVLISREQPYISGISYQNNIPRAGQDFVSGGSINTDEKFVLQTINSIDSLLTVTLSYINGQTIYTAKTSATTLEDIILTLNNDHLNKINNYTLKVSNRFGAQFSINIYISTIGAELNFGVLDKVENSYYLNVSDCSNDGILLEQIILQKYDANKNKVGSPVTITYTGTNNLILLDSNAWYEIKYTDNRGRTRGPQYVYTGEKFFSKEIYSMISGDFETLGTAYLTDGTYYVSNDIRLLYDASYYDITELKINGVDYSSKQLNGKLVEAPLYYEQGFIGNYSFITLLAERGTDNLDFIGNARVIYIKFSMKFNNQSDSQSAEILNLRIDNIIPQFSFENDAGESKNSVVSVGVNADTSTSESINILWSYTNNIDLVHYSFKINLYKNNVLLADITSEESNAYRVGYEDFGKYTIEILKYRNSTVILKKYLCFALSQNDGSLYTLSKLVDGQYVPMVALDYTTLGELKKVNRDVSVISSADTEYSEIMPIELFFTNLSSNFDDGEIVLQPLGDKNIIYRVAATINHGDFKTVLYQIKNDNTTTIKYEKLIAISYIKSADNKLLSANMSLLYKNPENDLDVTKTLKDNYHIEYFEKSEIETMRIPQTAFLSFAKSYFGTGASVAGGSDTIASKNSLYIEVSYNGQLITTYNLYNLSPAHIPFEYTGIYNIKIRDKAGNVHNFTSANNYIYTQYSLSILKTLPATVNGKPIVHNAVYGSDVVFEILGLPYLNYVGNSINYEIYKNGTLYFKKSFENNSLYEALAQKIILGENKIKLSEAGTYIVKYTAKIPTTSKTSIQIPEETLIFTIISQKESRLALDFTTIYNSYNLTKVLKIVNEQNGQTRDITAAFKSLLATNNLIYYQALVNAGNLLSSGKYIITYRIENRRNLPDQTIEFTMWIDNQTPAIISSIKPGQATTKAITIEFNKFVIYNQLGNCVLRITGEEDIIIDATTATVNAQTVKKLDKNKDYYVQIIGVGDSVISSFMVTKKEPLNTVSIILIIVAGAILIAGVTVFLVLRNKMKVR